MKITKDKVLELFKPILIAKVLDIRQHPNADRLVLVDVALEPSVDGEYQKKQVVTGAKNMQIGDFVPFLGEGNVVPGYLLMNGEEIMLKKKDLRGVESDSMILAEDEIGLSTDHTGILILENADEKLIGKSFTEIISDEQLRVILNNAGVVEITPELQEKIDLIKSIAKYGGEIVGEDELPGVLTSGEELITYDGFEPSGQMHIAQGIIRAINTNKMIKAGFLFKMLVADWYGYMNNKMGGDMEKIKTVGKYFIEIWRASGMDLDHTEFVWFSDIVQDSEYWTTVMKIAKATTLNRITKNVEIMGRSEKDTLTGAHIFYPCMQAADVFYTIKSQVTELGMDQRKVNIMAREVGEQLGFWKPVVVSHGMLQGLQKPVGDRKEYVEAFAPNTAQNLGEKYQVEVTVEDVTGNAAKFKVKDESGTVNYTTIEVGESSTLSGVTIELVAIEDNAAKAKFTMYDINPVDRSISMKMSKSKPDTAIFMTDTKEDIQRKIQKAYCPEGVVEDNPILDYCRQIIFEAHHLKGQENLLKDGFVVNRDEKFGGNVVYKTYDELEQAYVAKELFPLDLKNAVVEYIDALLEPVRKHFNENAEAKKLLEEVTSYQVTR